MNLTGSATQGATESAVPLSREKTSVSCMIDRLALSPATSCSTGTLSSGGEDLPELEQAGQAAVVSAVGAVGRAELIRAGQGEQLVRQVELGGGRLAAGQVEFQSLADQGVVRLGLLGVQVGELVRTEVGQGHGIHFESAAAGPSEILGRLARRAHDYSSQT